MEPTISNQPPRKSGRPTKQTKSETTKGSEDHQSQSSSSSDETTFVEAKKVELGHDHELMSASMDRDVYLAKYIMPKNPTKYFAWVNKEEAKQTWRHWHMLFWDTSKNTVTVVDSLDKASTTHGNVLCWRDMKVQKAVEADWALKQKRANDFQRKESTRTQAEKVGEAFDGIKSRYNLDQDALSVKPLGEET
jgi:hypothetical protein